MTRVSLMCFVLCAAACTSPAATATSSGGETSDTRMAAMAETTNTEPAEFEGPEQVEAGSALGVPPVSETNAETNVETNGDTNGEVSAVVVSESDAPPAVVPAPVVARPTTILAPARSGRLRLSDVHDVIREHRPEVTACYEEGLSRDRSLSGTAKVRFLIGPRGRIEDAEVYESSLGDEVVEGCILTAMRSWRFPRPRPRRSSVLLTYPYLLATE